MKITNEVKAGIFVIATLSLLFLSIFIMGKEKQIFASQEIFYATFGDVKGLSSGAPVRLGGITIGRVDEVSFSEKANDQSVYVKLLVNEDFLDRIRIDSVVSIETQGLLGDRFINISSGKEDRVLPANSKIKSEESGDIAQILAKAQKVVDNSVEIATNINTVLKDFTNNSAPNISDTSKSLKDIAKEIKDGDGLIHRLIYSKKDGDEIIKAISNTSKNIDSITDSVVKGDGILHALIYEPGGKELISSLSGTSNNLSKLAADITKITTEIREGNGMIHDLVFGDSPQGINDVIRQLNETANNLKTASDALAQGSGTLGALLVDPKLYDNLVEVTDGAKRSFILRQVIKSSLGK